MVDYASASELGCSLYGGASGNCMDWNMTDHIARLEKRQDPAKSHRHPIAPG